SVYIFEPPLMLFNPSKWLFALYFSFHEPNRMAFLEMGSHFAQHRGLPHAAHAMSEYRVAFVIK
ncbi:hypothetical protein J0S82_013611, partial [Galemys pyrenaicus]